MKVALVYDRVNKWGGAERVLLFLQKMFPDAPLFTSVYNSDKAAWANRFNIKTSFLQSFPSAKTSHEFYAPLMPLAFESFKFDNFDVVISVTSEAAKGIITKPETKHICYCLTPTRYLWSGYEHYFNNPIFKFLATPVVSYLRNWDKVASSRPDIIVSISSEVKNRVKEFYDRDSEIIFPPIFPDHKEKLFKPGKYFLVVSRLIPYKKIDLAIKACNKLRLPLKIVGTGSQLKYLKSIAGPTVEFLGHLEDERLIEMYAECFALIFPGLEDFGLVMAEANAFGKPVIAFRGGGALDIIREGKTGEFFNKQTEESLIRVLANFKPGRYNSLLCRENSERFSYSNFEKGFKKILANL